MVLSQYIADTYARELLTLPEGAVGYLCVNRVRDFAGALESVSTGATLKRFGTGSPELGRGRWTDSLRVNVRYSA